MDAVLFLNGVPEINDPQELDGAYIVCADGAYAFIGERIHPDLVLGDFDSLERSSIMSDIETLQFPVHKDFTDGQLAIRLLAERGYKNAQIYGALGGRPDQVMVNYSLLKLAATLGIKARIVTRDYYIYWLDDRFLGNASAGKIISVVPYGDSIHILSTEGLVYEAKNLRVENALITSISNQTVGGDYSVHIEGGALLFVER